MSKQTTYLIVIGVLVLINLLLFWGNNYSVEAPNKRFFAISDTSSISQVLIKYDGKEVLLKKEEGSWKLNNRFNIDQRFKDILFTLIQKVEIKREIGKWVEPIKNEVKVVSNGVDFSFGFATDPNKTKTYFVQDGVGLEVVVPGYRDNVADIFTLHPDQWRDRLVFDGSWRTIQSLEVESQDERKLTIKFSDRFFTVDGSTNIDSTRIVNYLNQFQFFEANEMISKGRFPTFDSLLKTPFEASLRISDIKYEHPMTLQIYPALKGDSFHLVVEGNTGQLMVIDRKRVAQVLSSNEEFFLD